MTKYIPFCNNPDSEHYEEVIKNIYYLKRECDFKKCVSCKFIKTVKDIK